MALKDYYKKLNFVEYKRVPDGFGGWKTMWEVGAEFDGLVTKASSTVQNTEALRGNLNVQYQVSVPLNTPLKKGDKIAFDWNGGLEYAEITNPAFVPPTQAQTQFLLFTAEHWEKPDNE